MNYRSITSAIVQCEYNGGWIDLWDTPDFDEAYRRLKNWRKTRSEDTFRMIQRTITDSPVEMEIYPFSCEVRQK